jgi:transcriptional regulator with XRE-family HTH domain
MRRLIAKIKNQRLTKHYSQEKLALLAYVSPRHYGRFESCQANITIKLLKKLARVLKTSVYELTKGA